MTSESHQIEFDWALEFLFLLRFKYKYGDVIDHCLEDL